MFVWTTRLEPVLDDIHSAQRAYRISHAVSYLHSAGSHQLPNMLHARSKAGLVASAVPLHTQINILLQESTAQAAFCTLFPFLCILAFAVCLTDRAKIGCDTRAAKFPLITVRPSRALCCLTQTCVSINVHMPRVLLQQALQAHSHTGVVFIASSLQRFCPGWSTGPGSLLPP